MIINWFRSCLGSRSHRCKKSVKRFLFLERLRHKVRWERSVNCQITSAENQRFFYPIFCARKVYDSKFVLLGFAWCLAKDELWRPKQRNIKINLSQRYHRKAKGFWLVEANHGDENTFFGSRGIGTESRAESKAVSNSLFFHIDSLCNSSLEEVFQQKMSMFTNWELNPMVSLYLKWCKERRQVKEYTWKKNSIEVIKNIFLPSFSRCG